MISWLFKWYLIPLLTIRHVAGLRLLEYIINNSNTHKNIALIPKLKIRSSPLNEYYLIPFNYQQQPSFLGVSVIFLDSSILTPSFKGFFLFFGSSGLVFRWLYISNINKSSSLQLELKLNLIILMYKFFFFCH